MFPARKSGGRGGGGLTLYDAMCRMVKSNFAKKSKARRTFKTHHDPPAFFKHRNTCLMAASKHRSVIYTCNIKEIEG